MLSVVCPSCRKKIHPPDHLAGRRVTCPRCEGVVEVPLELIQAVEEASTPAETSSSTEDAPFPPSARLGIIALALGLISILILCLPIIGYLSIGLSSIGLVTALAGLIRSRIDGSVTLPQTPAGGTGLVGGFGVRARDYPLAGVVACLLALILALLPTLFS
jgi:hypothetical protein